MLSVLNIEDSESLSTIYASTPARKAEVHRMMISQTGEGKADKGAELVPPAERTKTHTGRPEQ